jgi:chemotaxis regulatin CheY-phosphate phosphatase CheZ
MSEALKLERGNLGVVELQAEVARMADMVCEATRQAALDGIASALSVAADRSLETPDRVRDIANQVLSRACIMQSEIDRFMKVARGQRH